MDLFVCLREHHLEPKQIQFVRHRAQSPINLVLVCARRCGRPGITYLPDYILYRDDRTETEAYRMACGR